MRLTVKLVFWFLFVVVLATGINGVYGVRGEIERYEADLAARHVVMGRVLRSAFSEVMDTDGETRAVSVLDYTDKRMRLVDVRWVHLEEGAVPERKPFVPLSRLAPLREDKDVHDRDDTGGKKRLRTYVPVHIEGKPISALEFSEALEGERDVVRHAVLRGIRTTVAIAFAIGVAAAVLGVLLVARPMRRLVLHARRIGQADLSPMPESRSNDEIAELGREMNAMCERLAEAQSSKLKALEQLRHAERLSTVGKLASGLAHELGTPLNVISLRAKAIAQKRALGDRAVEAATSIGEQATRVTNLVRQLLDFARRRQPQRDAVDIEALVVKTADLLEPIASKAKVDFDVAMAQDTIRVKGDAGQLEQVLTNLMMNAIQAMPAGGTVQLATNVVEAAPPADHGGAPGAFVEVMVHDSGTGIPNDVLPHIFEPFFTTKDVGEGTGLGLAVCYGIVRDHGGWIEVKTSTDEGSRFAVYLPREPS